MNRAMDTREKVDIPRAEEWIKQGEPCRFKLGDDHSPLEPMSQEEALKQYEQWKKGFPMELYYERDTDGEIVLVFNHLPRLNFFEKETNENNQPQSQSADGKQVGASMRESILMLLSSMTAGMLEKTSNRERDLVGLFNRLTDNFIRVNTYEDLKGYINHGLTMKMIDFFKR